MLNSQTSLPGTFAKCGQREKDQVAGHFKTSPTVFEPPVPKTVEVRRGYNKTARTRTETVSALAKQNDWINGMLNHMIECNGIELLTGGYVGNHTIKHF